MNLLLQDFFFHSLPSSQRWKQGIGCGLDLIALTTLDSKLNIGDGKPR